MRSPDDRVAPSSAAHRSPKPKKPALRGPGKWLPVAEAEAFAASPRLTGAWLDASTLGGKAVLFVAMSLLFAGAAWLHESSPQQAYLVALDGAALLVLFGTGRARELPPDPRTAAAPFLRAVATRVRKALPQTELRVVGRIRVPEGSSEPDELRLSVSPRQAHAGFGSIEVGVVFAPGTSGFIALPEVLLRMTEGSACDEALSLAAKLGRSTRGRKAGERVVAYSPRLPTVAMTAGLVARLVTAAVASAPAKPHVAEASPKSTRKAA